MKIYIHRETGLATAAISSTTALQNITGVLGSTLHLDCIFHDGTAAVELDPSAVGAIVAKQDKHYTDASLVQALTWTKQSAPEDGYRFTLRPAGEALVALLANLDNAPLMAQIVWTESGVERKTQKLSFTVGNAVYREDEPTLADPTAAWPLPGEVATKAYVQAAVGSGGASTSTVVTPNSLPYSSTVTTDAGAGTTFDLTLTGDCTLANPTNPTNGKKVEWRIAASGGDRQLSVGDKFALPSASTVTFPVTVPSGKLIIFMAEYYQPFDRWLIQAFIPAY